MTTWEPLKLLALIREQVSSLPDPTFDQWHEAGIIDGINDTIDAQTPRVRAINGLEIRSEGFIHNAQINGRPVTGIREMNIHYKANEFTEVVLTAVDVGPQCFISEITDLYVVLGDRKYKIVEVTDAEDGGPVEG